MTESKFEAVRWAEFDSVTIEYQIFMHIESGVMRSTNADGSYHDYKSELPLCQLHADSINDAIRAKIGEA